MLLPVFVTVKSPASKVPSSASSAKPTIPLKFLPLTSTTPTPSTSSIESTKSETSAKISKAPNTFLVKTKAFEVPSSEKKDKPEPSPVKKPVHIPCNICGKVFSWPFLLDQHMRETHHVTRRVHRCKICSRSFHSVDGLENHVETGHTETTCNLCGVTFNCVLKFKRHTRTLSHQGKLGPSENPCKICGIVLSSKILLNQHVRQTHPTDAKRSIATLNYGTRTRTVHEDKSKLPTVLCEVCGKAFTTKSSLVDHMRIHNNERPYICKICDRKFRQSGQLKCHLVTHEDKSKVPNFLCEVCGKAFKYKWPLIDHMRIHSNEKPYICKICGTKFRQSSQVKYHLRTHTKEKPFKCEFCKKSFSIKAVLLAHQRIHTGEKLFACERCNQRFMYLPTMKKHAARCYPGTGTVCK